MKSNKPFRILAVDPGTKNFGFSIIEVSGKEPRLVACGLLDETLLIYSLSEQTLTEAVCLFQSGFTKLLVKSRADCVSAERYLIQRRGTTGESVNMMLALMAAAGKPMQIFMAATWKARLKKHLGCTLEEVYAITTLNGKKVPDHAIDATMQGLFFAERELGVPIKWSAKQVADKVSQTYRGVWK